MRLEQLLLTVVLVVVEQQAGSSTFYADCPSVSLQFELELITCLRTDLHLAASIIGSIQGHSLLRSRRRL